MSHAGGRTLGGYQLLSQLAVGGMAEIYIARTHGVGGFEKLVALKVIHPNFSADPDFVRMLVDEAKLSVQLQHANIVQTFDLGRVEEQYYIAMELIDGIDLYKLLRRASEHDIDFPFEVAAFITAEVCGGLDYAHRKRDARGRPLQIVHRDVSPQNVLVSVDGEVKIVDFGIAKAALRGQQTAAGVIKGKYYYMSPEQAWGDPIDARTDIFSAGILLYEMCVGQMLYMEDDIEKLLDVVRKASIPPPSSQRMGVPRELEAIVMRALKKSANDRWQSAGELAQALTQFIHGFAPDFSRARLATFVREVMGDDPTAERRDPRTSTAHAAGLVSAIEVRDENSLLFSLSDVAAPAEEQQAPSPSPPRAAARPSPRRADVPTHVRGGGGGDFEENEATIVDAGDTLMARMEPGDGDRTRPAGPPVRRGSAQVPSGKFDLGPDDPAADADLEVPTLTPGLGADEDDLPTSTRELPPAERAPEGAGRTHQRRPLTPPLDEEDEPTPEEVIGARALPGVQPQAERESRPTPLGVRTRQPNAPRALEPLAPTAPMSGAATGRSADDPAAGGARPAMGPRPPTPQPDAPRPALAQPNAPEPVHDEVDTRQRTRPSPEGRRARAASPSGFADDAPEPTVAARPRPSPTPPPATAPSAAAAATQMLPPSQHPLAGGARAGVRQGFEEPTRIPAPAPPPLDSGRFVPGLEYDPSSGPPFPSPLGEPADAPLRRAAPRALWIGLAAAAVVGVGVVAALALSGGGDSRGTLSVVSLPPGAEVRVDGAAVAGGGTSAQVTPLTLSDVDPRQTHHVRVSKGGFDVWESDVKFPAGEHEVRVQAVLMPTVGTVEIASAPPGAEAIVNGRIRGMTPTTVGDLPPNDDVVIELRLRGYKVAHKTVSWAGKRLLAVSIPLEKAK